MYCSLQICIFIKNRLKWSTKLVNKLVNKLSKIVKQKIDKYI